MTATPKNTNAERKRSKRSIEKTLDRYEMTNALMKWWHETGKDETYLKRLRMRATKLRAELRIKGVLLEDDIDF